MGEKIYGYHALEEALKSAPRGSYLYLESGKNERLKRLENLALSTGKVRTRKLSREEIKKLTPGEDNRGAVLELFKSPIKTREEREITVKEFCSSLKDGEESLVLILDGITDPHNLGAILRSSDQFGVDLVVIPERRSGQVNETVHKVSSGAASYVKTATVTNLNREIEELKKNGFWIYAADMAGESSYKIKFAPRTAIVMGSEGSGISELVRKNSDYIVSIPMQGHIDSLNVSVATGILLYEVRRK